MWLILFVARFFKNSVVQNISKLEQTVKKVVDKIIHKHHYLLFICPLVLSASMGVLLSSGAGPPITGGLSGGLATATEQTIPPDETHFDTIEFQHFIGILQNPLYLSRISHKKKQSR